MGWWQNESQRRARTRSYPYERRTNGNAETAREKEAFPYQREENAAGAEPGRIRGGATVQAAAGDAGRALE